MEGEGSGMRQRKAVSSSSGSKDDPAQGSEGSMMDDSTVQFLQEKLEEVKRNRVIGISNASKKMRDELEKDPYNHRLIYELALQYEQDDQPANQAAVLSRCWRKVANRESSPLNEKERANFLVMLADRIVVTKGTTYQKRSLEVFNTIGEPMEEDETEGEDGPRIDYWVTAAKVYAVNKQYQKTIEAFNKAIHNKNFDYAAWAWTICRCYLKEVGAESVCEAKIKAMVDNEANQKKFDSLRKIISMGDEAQEMAMKPRKIAGVLPIAQVRKLSWVFLILGAVGAYLLQTEDVATLSKVLMAKLGVK